jgi:hypothetical protein
LKRALPVGADGSSGGDRYARIEEGPDHRAFRNCRPGGRLSRARDPGG